MFSLICLNFSVAYFNFSNFLEEQENKEAKSRKKGRDGSKKSNLKYVDADEPLPLIVELIDDDLVDV